MNVSAEGRLQDVTLDLSVLVQRNTTWERSLVGVLQTAGRYVVVVAVALVVCLVFCLFRFSSFVFLFFCFLDLCVSFRRQCTSLLIQESQELADNPWSHCCSVSLACANYHGLLFHVPCMSPLPVITCCISLACPGHRLSPAPKSSPVSVTSDFLCMFLTYFGYYRFPMHVPHLLRLLQIPCACFSPVSVTTYFLVHSSYLFQLPEISYWILLHILYLFLLIESSCFICSLILLEISSCVFLTCFRDSSVPLPDHFCRTFRTYTVIEYYMLHIHYPLQLPNLSCWIFLTHSRH